MLRPAGDSGLPALMRPKWEEPFLVFILRQSLPESLSCQAGQELAGPLPGWLGFSCQGLLETAGGTGQLCQRPAGNPYSQHHTHSPPRTFRIARAPGVQSTLPCTRLPPTCAVFGDRGLTSCNPHRQPPQGHQVPRSPLLRPFGLSQGAAQDTTSPVFQLATLHLKTCGWRWQGAF